MKTIWWILLGVLVLLVVYLAVRTKTTLTLKINKKCTYKSRCPHGGILGPPEVEAALANSVCEYEGLMMDGVCGPDPSIPTVNLP